MKVRFVCPLAVRATDTSIARFPIAGFAAPAAIVQAAA